jgi:hypothetical protein
VFKIIFNSFSACAINNLFKIWLNKLTALQKKV